MSEKIAESITQIGQRSIVESPIQARGGRVIDNGAVATTRMNQPLLGNGSVRKKMVKTQKDERDREQQEEDFTLVASQTSLAPSSLSLMSDPNTLDTFHRILEILRGCWTDLEQSMIPPNDDIKDKLSPDYQLERLVFAVSNRIPKPIQQHSKLAQIQALIQTMLQSNPRDHMKQFKNILDEECNNIKGKCDQCISYYKELMEQLQKNDPFFKDGCHQWEQIRDHVALARNETKRIFQQWVRMDCMNSSTTSSNETLKLKGKTKERSLNKKQARLPKHRDNLDGRNGMKLPSSHRDIFLPPISPSTPAFPMSSKKNAMKRKRSTSPDQLEQQQPKRSRTSIPHKIRSSDSLVSATIMNSNPDAKATLPATTKNPRVDVPSRRNRVLQRPRKAKVMNPAIDDEFDKFRRTYMIEDKDPRRLTNPLLELPQFSCQSKSESFPQSSEMLTLMNLYFPQPDTFPLSYYARLLGFDVPSSAIQSDHYYEFDALTVPLMDSSKDDSYCIPDEEPGCRSVINRPNSLEDERRLDLLHPVLKSLLEDLIFQRNDCFIEAPHNTVISSGFIDFAREHGMIDDDLEFRSFKNGDEKYLAHGVSII